MSETTTTYLSIGDYVCLFYVKLSSNLCAEGILGDDINVGDKIESFDDCLFQIHLQRQYSASNELSLFLSPGSDTASKSEINTEDLATKRFLHALEKGQENENKMNSHFLQQKLGSPVLFGDIIQLFHVKSGKYLTVSPTELGKTEKENVRIYLNPDGDSNSWLQILPRFKIDREGDRVAGSTEAYFRFADRANEFLHCADKSFPNSNTREANSALDSPTPWRVNIYQRHSDTLMKDHILGGQLIYLLDPEVKAYLTVLSLPCIVKVLSDKESNERAAKLNKSKKGLDDRSLASQDKVVSRKGSVESIESMESFLSKDEASLAESIGSIQEFINNNGSVVLSRMENLDSNILWVVEKNPFFKGGSIKCKADVISLRHLNTGKYLSLLSNNEIITTEATTMAFAKLILTDKTTLDTGFFNLIELNPKISILNTGHPINIVNGALFAQRGEYYDEFKSYSIVMSKMKAKATSLIIHKYIEPPVSMKYSIAQPLDTAIGIAAERYFNYCISKILLPDFSLENVHVSSIWNDPDDLVLKSFSEIVSKLVRYINGFPISEGIIPVTSALGQETVLNRQNLLKEQGIIFIIIHILSQLSPISSYCMKEDYKDRVDCSAVFSSGLEIIACCFKLLIELVSNNPKNQLYLADFLMVIISHADSEELAGKLIKLLFEKNLELQETKVTEEEIIFFAEKLRDRNMSSVFLNLMGACCVCRNKGVGSNQHKVYKAIFDISRDVLIQFKLDYDIKSQVEWGNSVLYPVESNNNSVVALGKPLYDSGVPEVLVTWKSKSLNYSPQKLFSKSEVSLGDLFRFNFLSPSKGGSELNRLRKTVGNFLIAQLNLMANMCLGRNYIIMKEISQIYSLELLITLIASSENDELRGAAARLAQSLYIDCDPQSVVIIPRLSRPHNEIGLAMTNHNDNDNNSVKFSLFQQLISTLLIEYKGKPFGNTILSMAQLLNHLLSFNFYSSMDKLQDILIPLVAAIERKSVEYEDMTQLNVKSMKRGSVRIVRRMSTRKSLSMNKSFEKSIKEAVENVETNEEQQDLSQTWPATILSLMESLYWMFFIMFLVVLAISVAAYQFVTDSNDVAFEYFDYIIFSVFVLEIMIRGVCYRYVNGEVLTFLSNPFNQIDLVVISIDVMLFIIGGIIGSEAKFSKILRILRLIRLVRIFRAAKIINKIIADSLHIYAKWKFPSRYSYLPEVDVKTMVVMLQDLRSIQNILEDKSITEIMYEFYLWEKNESNSNSSPSKSFLRVCDLMKTSSVSNDSNDDIFIDLLMYSNRDIVQNTLDILMTHHTAAKTLYSNLSLVQMIVSSKREKQYLKIEKIIFQLKHDADTHSVWGKLTNDEHKKINLETLSSFKELTNMLRNRPQAMEFDEEYLPDHVVQDMMRNLGCFDMSFTFFNLVHNLGENTLSESYKNTMKLLINCSEMFYWFVKLNVTNQNIAYEKLDFFVSNIDRGINTHKVISAIFINNIDLMKICPKHYIADLVEKIVHNGHSYHNLVLLGAISPNVIEKQFEVIRQLTNPLWVKEILSFFCPVTSSAYEKKKRLMIPYINKSDLSPEDLPSELAYHLELLRVFAGCSVGRANMNSIEAKIQSLYNYNDVVMAILDPNSPIIVKVRLLQFLYNAMIDVEMKIPNLSVTKSIWLFIESTVEIFSTTKDLLRQIEKVGWESPVAHRQKLEYAVLCAKSIATFFQLYFDRSVFKAQAQASGIGFERVNLKENQISELIRNLFSKIRDVYEMQSPLLSVEHTTYFYDCLVIINVKATVPIVAEVKILHDTKDLKNELAERNQSSVSNKFSKFKKEILENEECIANINNSEDDILSKIEKIPRVKDSADSDVRLEPFLEKIVSHIRNSIVITFEDSKIQSNLDVSKTKTSIWMIKIFRSLIERKWGMTIHERDDEGGAEQDEAFQEIMTMLNECGATTLCFDLIVNGIDKKLQMEAINLLVAMLFKEGGNFEVQNAIFNHLCSPKSELFFLRGREIFNDMIFWHQYRGVIELSKDEEPELPQEIMLLRVMQLMCEGHFSPTQDIYRQQPANHININFLDDMVNYFMALNGLPCRTSTAALLSLTALILEVIQGPCEGNQDHFALNTQLIEILNKQLRAEGGIDNVLSEELELKKSCIDIFQGLLEGQGSKKEVYDRVLSVVHIDIIYLMSSVESFESYKDTDVEDIAQELQTESMVLLKILCNYRPSIAEELGISVDGPIADSSTTSVEVIWRGELQRRFFHIPDLCQYLSISSRERFIETVDRKLQENKLNGLLDQSRIFYREILHQEMLTKYKLSYIFSRANLERSTWTSFYLACIINFLQLIFYTHAKCGSNPNNLEDDTMFLKICGDPIITKPVAITILVLNVTLVVFSAFTVLIYLVVRSPVIFQFNSAELENTTDLSPRTILLRSALITATDGMTLYSFLYLGFAIGGLFNPLLLPFLVLDIFTKNSYAADIITAVIYPGKALLITGIILCIQAYIVSFFIFLFYNNENNISAPDQCDTDPCNICDTLANCFKSFLRYGIPNADNGLIITIGSRYLVDVWFFIQVYILLNIVKGITIDTFVELRQKKLEREHDTTEVCFICGLPKVIFDRKLGRTAFKDHYKFDHNLWSYFYFIIYIWEQDKDDDDGLEQFIRRAIEAKDISWIPMGRSMVLDTNDQVSRNDAIKSSFRAELIAMESKIQKSVKSCEEHFKTITSKIHRLAQPLAINNIDIESIGSIESSLHDSFTQFSIKIVLKDLKGLDTSRFLAGDSIICRIISNSLKDDITAISDGGENYYFPEEHFKIHHSDSENLTKTCAMIQIIRRCKTQDSDIYLGSLDFKLQEFHHKSVTLIEKEFVQSVSNNICSMTIITIPPGSSQSAKNLNPNHVSSG